MKIGSLVAWKHNPFIGVIIAYDDLTVRVHWLDDGYVSWEDSCENPLHKRPIRPGTGSLGQRRYNMVSTRTIGGDK